MPARGDELAAGTAGADEGVLDVLAEIGLAGTLWYPGLFGPVVGVNDISKTTHVLVRRFFSGRAMVPDAQ